MQIAIIGGSQGTGAELATLAQAAGHEVTVVSRSGRAPEGVTVITGNALEAAVASKAVDGADAVVVTVGGARGVAHHRAAVTRAVIAAMQDAGVGRILVQSSLGVGESSAQLPGLLRVITPLLLAKPLADHAQQEAAVMNSGLEWTVVRPTGLTNKAATASWRAIEVGEAGNLTGTISRKDLAACMLELLETASSVGKAYGLSN